MSIALIIIFFIFGTLIGSFLNVIIWRLPRQQKITGRSQCPHCKTQLGAKNLVPVLSYLWQGRKCASCGAPMSPRYFIIELVTGLLFAAAVAHTHLVGPVDYVLFVRLLFIISVLIAVFVIDLEHYLILDNIIWPATATVLLLTIISDVVAHRPVLLSSAVDGLIAAILASGFFYLIWKVSRGRWMGFGDVKFNLLLGLALGLGNTIVGLMSAFFLGSVVGLALIATGRKKLSSKIPFGTFLSAGALVALFYGPQIWQWYLNLIGWS